MAHKSLEQLREDLKVARNQVQLGGLYRHYKHPDEPYKVLDLVVNESDDEVAVIYCSGGSPEVKFSRPVKVWLETVERDGKQVPRFLRVDNPNR